MSHVDAPLSGSDSPPPYNAEGAQITDTCVVPWKTSFRLGHGVDALTGDCRGKSVDSEDFAVESLPSGEIKQYIHLCCNTDSVRRTFGRNTTAQLALNFEPLDLRSGLMARALNHIEYSSTTFSLVIRWTSTTSLSNSAGHPYVLEQRAAELLRSSPTKFREAYGDYFVAGCSRGSQFDAVLTFKCDSSEKQTEALSSLSGKVGFTAESYQVSADLQNDLVKLKDLAGICAQVSLHIEMYGVNPAPKKPQPRPLTAENIASELQAAHVVNPVLEILEWFQGNLQPALISAELRPYSLIDDTAVESLPKTLPVAASAFTELEKIRGHVLNCTTATTALSAVITNTPLQERLDAFYKKCAECQPKLPTDSALRQEMLKEAGALYAECVRFCAAWDLWRTTRSYKPWEGVQEATREVRRSWSLGRQESSTPTEPLQVYKRKFKRARVRWVFGRRYEELDVADLQAPDESTGTGPNDPHSPRERIVGWSIVSLSARGTWEALHPRNCLLYALSEGSGRRDKRDSPEALFSVSSDSPHWLSDKWDVALFLVKDEYLDTIVQRFPF